MVLPAWACTAGATAGETRGSTREPAIAGTTGSVLEELSARTSGGAATGAVPETVTTPIDIVSRASARTVVARATTVGGSRLTRELSMARTLPSSIER